MRLARALKLLGPIPGTEAAADAPCGVSFDQRGLEESGELSLLGAASPKRRPFRSLRSGDPQLDRVVMEAHRLHPIAAAFPLKGGLALDFETPVPWPFFLRLDLAKPFAARAAELCARLGSLGVDRVALARGRMSVRVV